jgi:hypothetical protein
VLSTSGFGSVSLFELTFTTNHALSATIYHDDGISLWNSNNSIDLFNYAVPVSITGNSISVLPGTYNLWYAEANGAPADLQFADVSIPEPATLALFGAGLLGFGAWRRRKKKAA